MNLSISSWRTSINQHLGAFDQSYSHHATFNWMKSDSFCAGPSWVWAAPWWRGAWRGCVTGWWPSPWTWSSLGCRPPPRGLTPGPQMSWGSCWPRRGPGLCGKAQCLCYWGELRDRPWWSTLGEKILEINLIRNLHCRAFPANAACFLGFEAAMLSLNQLAPNLWFMGGKFERESVLNTT